MRKLNLAGLIVGIFPYAPLHADSASTAGLESAWLAFNNARGEASLIAGDLEHPSANAIFRIIPDVSADALDEDKLQLGFDLFNEARLSRDGSIACASCHIGMLGGVDRRPLPIGIGGAQGEFNAPTVFNAALNFRQFWDGRALTLQEQALGPIENPAEFGHDLEGAITVLNNIPEYVSTFDKLYPDGITAANLGDAIAYYETMNFTGLDSPFLRQFQDQGEALSPQALRGQQRFVEVGCAGCHNGVNLGGNSYQQLGVAADWYDSERPATAADNGLFGRTGRLQDRHVFKVPGLHNVAITGPWLHDGSITSLQQAVDQMAQKQSGRYLDNRDIDDIVAFLRTLGDPLALIGDCAASGGYAVTMDCSVRQVSASTQQVPSPSPGLPATGQLPALHLQAYKEAQQKVTAAPARIEAEMQRIRSGEVAHYDFLQFEHIEMLRHARALFFPPADLDATARASLLAQATRWQQSAEEYELVIADFLRSHAIASSARANYQDPLNVLSDGANEDALTLLSLAEQSVLAFYAEPSTQTQQELELATDALFGLQLNPQRLAELRLQVQLLAANLSIPQV